MGLVLPEIVLAGVYNSEVTQKGVAVSPVRETALYELEIPLEPGGVSYVDGVQVPVCPGRIICAAPGRMRHSRFPLKTYYVHMRIDGGSAAEMLDRLPPFIETANPEKYYQLFERIGRHYASGSAYDRVVAAGLCLELIGTVCGEYAAAERFAEKGGTAAAAAVRRALGLIDADSTADLSLERVAGYVNVSPSHFHKCFRAYVGMTLREYVEERRIERAIRLLTETDRTLTDIALDCGFSSQAYFSCAFKRKTGMTPREYTKEFNRRYGGGAGF